MIKSKTMDVRTLCYVSAILSLTILSVGCKKQTEDQPQPPSIEQNNFKNPLGNGDVSIESAPAMVALPITLPQPVFQGTPQNIKVKNLEKPLGKPRPAFLAPSGTINIVAGIVSESTDDMPIIGEIEMISDGDREATDGSYVELGPGRQYLTFDLGKKHDLYAVLFWHYHRSPRVYFDIIVQLADDADFLENVRTIFNNDDDNSSDLGTGKDMHYVETAEGKLVDAKGHVARYVRLYSNGNNENDLNHYVEVEIYGKPCNQ